MKEERPTIIIAEDDDTLREMYIMALNFAGFYVLPARDGASVMEWLEKKHLEVKLILLDVVMPIMDGFETLAKIKKDERFKKISVLISTNLDNSEDRQHSFAMGAKDYYVKSQHTPAELVAKINAVLAEEKQV